MGREIRFRAWYEKQKAMISPLQFNARINNIHPSFIPMQYTGLKDKNGVDIYEGDIIEYPLSERDGNGVRNGVIEFIEGGFCIKWTNRIAKGCRSLIGQYPEVSVIGNIHQNPELL